MREVRVMNLEDLEVAGGETRVLANSGDLVLVFPRKFREGMPAEFSPLSEPTAGEFEALKTRLEEHARELVRHRPRRARAARRRGPGMAIGSGAAASGSSPRS